MDLTDYQTFAESQLKITFKDLGLLVTAFTHRSYINEHKKTVGEHNERLEFLGDAVLELVVTEYLYNNFSEPEGILTNWRSSLVRTESISAAASREGFASLLRLSRGERKAGSERAREQILANTYESVIGAIYLDQGYEIACEFITRTLLPTFQDILEKGSWMDPKSHLQEVVQSKVGHTPEYRVLSEEGPDHEKYFTVGVYVAGTLKGKGTGPSKQAAQVSAAAQALTKYKK